MESYKFFQNRACEYFPCHSGANPETFNCLFCYCPLYALGNGCGGNFSFTASGIKDCSSCRIPHEMQNYDRILARMEAVLELAKREAVMEEIP